MRNSGSAVSNGASQRVLRSKLEVEPGDYLHQPSARILSVVHVSIGRRHLAKLGVREIGHVGIGEEVDVVKGVQELAAQLEVDFFGDPDPFNHAQIEAGEHRACDVEILRSAFSADHLNAACAIGRRNVAPGGLGPAVAAGGGRAYAEGSDRIVNDVLRQVVDHAFLVIEVQPEHLPEFLLGHADQVDVAEVQNITALDARRAIELQTADE